jgi:hypothetical protein
VLGSGLISVVRRSPQAIVALVACLPAFGQPAQVTTPAPVPAAILSGRKGFVSNAGVDNYSLQAFQRAGDVNEPYNRFYAAMADWGRYELTGTPSDADLVFEVRFTAPVVDTGKLTAHAPQLQLTILDARSHFILWYIAQPVDGAVRKATWEKNFDGGIASMLASLKGLVAGAPRSAGHTAH